MDNILSAAQQTPSEDRPVIQISADKSSFYSLQDTSIVRRPIRDNIRIPIDRIRFLSLESVRNELKLSGSTKKSLKPLVRLVIRFDRQDKWNFYSSTTEVSAIAKSNVKEFAEEIEKVVKEQLISESQMEHLDQVRLRFNCLGLDRADPEFSPIKKVISELGLTADQRNAIREIFADELSDLLSLRKQFDSIFQVLDESQRLEIEQVFQPFLELTTPVGLSLAQCQDIRSIEEIENKFESEFDLELLDRVVLTPSGQLEIESVFVEGGEGVFMPRPWAQILDQCLSERMDWLQLVDDQEMELRCLRKDRVGDDGIGIQVDFGTEAFADIEPSPLPNWSARKYSDWQGQRLKAGLKADELLGERIKVILLPHQIEAIKTALAVSRTLELGPYNLFADNLSDYLKITTQQKTRILKLRDERLSELRSKYKAIDLKAIRELSREQKEFMARNFGDHCGLYPCFWQLLVVGD